MIRIPICLLVCSNSGGCPGRENRRSIERRESHLLQVYIHFNSINILLLLTILLLIDLIVFIYISQRSYQKFSVNNVTEYHVKYKGLEAKYNEWVTQASIDATIFKNYKEASIKESTKTILEAVSLDVGALKDAFGAHYHPLDEQQQDCCIPHDSRMLDQWIRRMPPGKNPKENAKILKFIEEKEKAREADLFKGARFSVLPVCNRYVSFIHPFIHSYVFTISDYLFFIIFDR